MFTELSTSLTKQLSRKIKRENGIFFTSLDNVGKVLDCIEEHGFDYKTVLEPSAGSCQFVLEIKRRYPHVNITAIENNEQICKLVRETHDDFGIQCADFLDYLTEQKFDLIIGNPPYGTIKPRSQYGKKTREILKEHGVRCGKPNMYIPFIVKCLDMLNDCGVLAFVLPQSFLDTCEYGGIREKIISQYDIIKIIELNDDFAETKQNTCAIIIQNSRNFKWCIGNKMTLNRKEIMSLETNYRVGDIVHDISVGRLVWNQHKDKLTDDPSVGTPIIYDGHIGYGEYREYKISKQGIIHGKKLYIEGYEKEPERAPVLAITRGHGGGQLSFRCCIIDLPEFYLENHVYVVKHNNISVLRDVMLSLNSEQTKKYIQATNKNGSVNKKNILNFPLFNVE